MTCLLGLLSEKRKKKHIYIYIYYIKPYGEVKDSLTKIKVYQLKWCLKFVN